MQCDSIGVFHTDFSYKYDVARQGVFFQGHPGVISLNPGFDYEQALRDLGGFERIWLIFQFHQNKKRMDHHWFIRFFMLTLSLDSLLKQCDHNG